MTNAVVFEQFQPDYDQLATSTLEALTDHRFENNTDAFAVKCFCLLAKQYAASGTSLFAWPGGVLTLEDPAKETEFIDSARQNSEVGCGI